MLEDHPTEATVTVTMENSCWLAQWIQGSRSGLDNDAAIRKEMTIADHLHRRILEPGEEGEGGTLGGQRSTCWRSRGGAGGVLIPRTVRLIHLRCLDEEQERIIRLSGNGEIWINSTEERVK